MGIYDRIEQRVTLPGDSETLRSQKTISVFLMFLGSLFTMVNVTNYLSLGIKGSAYAYLGIVIIALLSTFLVLAIPKLWLPVGYFVIFATILFNMAASLFAGGFESGLEAAVWMMLGPLVASLFFSPLFTVVSLFIYIIGIIAAAYLEPFAQAAAPEIDHAIRMRIAASNLILMGIFVTAASLYLLRRVDYYRRRADELLSNMLPEPIAARLKVSKETIADHYDEVTVLFADMVGSTPLFADLEPAEAVDWLNEVFLMFDELIENYHLEKIRTIGDNYMIAAGVPLPRADHAQAMTELALEMQSGLESIPSRGGKKMVFRIGINSGPLVAGVIGKSKYQYDLWGDTVNLASRMESLGEAGQVHVTPATYALIKDDFDCTSRGTIPVKGKGEMETWFVKSRKGARL